MSQGAWHPDPYQRHQFRWWDGAQWTSLVSDNGVTSDEAAAPAAQQPMVQQTPVPQPPMMQQPPMAQTQPMLQTQPAGPSKNRLPLIVGAVVVVAALVVIGIVVLGGGDDGGGGRDSQTAEGREYVAAIVASSTDFGEEETRCLAEGVVDIVGVEELQSNGITPDNIGSGDGVLGDYVPAQATVDELVDMMFGCVNFGELFLQGMTGSGLAIPDDQIRCIGSELAESQEFRDFVSASVFSDATGGTGPDESAMQTLVVGIFETCGVDMTALGG